MLDKKLIFAKMTIRKHIPNFITSLNLLSGSIAIAVAFDGMLVLSAYLIVLASILDFMDGFIARSLNAYSEIGKQLDSLADVISFGLAPSVIIFILMVNNPQTPAIMVDGRNLIPFIAFLLPVFSALRLAKFNIDNSQADSFTGLPTPASALLIISFPLIKESSLSTDDFPFDLFNRIISQPYFLIIVVTLLSFLMISRFKLFSLKFKTTDWNTNKLRYIFLSISLIFLIIMQCAGIPLIFLLYLLLSFIFPEKNLRKSN